MKTLNKKKLFKNVFYVFGLSCVLGLSSCSSYNYEYKEDNIYQYEAKLSRKNITYDESTYTITYSNDDMPTSSTNQDLWQNVYDTLYDNGYYYNNDSLSVTGTIKVAGNTTYNLTSVDVRVISTTYQIRFFSNYQQGAIQLVKSGENGNWSTDSPVLIEANITSETYYNLFAPQDDMPQVLNDFVSILVGGIQQLAVGIANGVASMASALFLAYDNGAVTGLSLFGGIVAVFAGLALAVGITTRVYLWITRLGKD